MPGQNWEFKLVNSYSPQDRDEMIILISGRRARDLFDPIWLKD